MRLGVQQIEAHHRKRANEQIQHMPWHAFLYFSGFLIREMQNRGILPDVGEM
jgi:hypothetical protein